MPKRPQAVELTSRLLWLLVAGGLLVSILVVVRRDAIARQWPQLHADDGAIRPVSFVPVVLVLYVVIAITVLILVSMFRQAQAWTRIALTVLGLGTVAGCFAIMRTAPPTSVRWALVVAAMLAAATLVVLWHPTVGGYLHGIDRSELAGGDQGDAVDQGDPVDADDDAAADAGS